MPNVAAANWHFGTHARNRDDALAACLKLGWHRNRLHDSYHDSYKETKWDQVEPQPGHGHCFDENSTFSCGEI